MGYYLTAEPGVNIYVEDINPAGRKALLFIHGWPANHNMFEYQFDHLSRVGYRCIGMDLRGFGMSDKPGNGYNYDRMADDVRCVVDALQLHSFMLIGHSVGGAIAVRYIARHDGYEVAKLVLLAAAAPSVIKRAYFPYGLPRKDVVQIVQNTYRDRPNMLRNFGDMFFHQEISKPFSDWFFQMGLQAAGWATAAVAAAWLNEERLFADLGKIQAPTLIMHGIHDRVCLFPLAEAQRERIPHSRLVPFKDSGHGLFWEERNKLNRELALFIG